MLLLNAAYHGSTIACKLLLAAGSDVNRRTKDGLTPLHLAAYHGHQEVCELLLAAGSDVEERQPNSLFTPLHWAAVGGPCGDHSVADLTQGKC